MGDRIGDLRPGDILTEINRLRARVAALERRVNQQAVMLVPDNVTLGSGSTSYQRMAWASFVRSGSQVFVGVNVTLTGAESMDLSLRADGAEIGATNVTTGGPATLSGFLPDSWEFGEHRTIEVYGKLNSPSGTAAGSIVPTGGGLR